MNTNLWIAVGVLIVTTIVTFGLYVYGSPKCSMGQNVTFVNYDKLNVTSLLSYHQQLCQRYLDNNKTKTEEILQLEQDNSIEFIDCNIYFQCVGSSLYPAR